MLNHTCDCVCYNALQVAGVLDFMNACYTIFGFTYELNLSTRPKKALGSKELWDQAEAMMKDALETFGRPWKINAGDGAFYGPKVLASRCFHLPFASLRISNGWPSYTSLARLA